MTTTFHPSTWLFWRNYHGSRKSKPNATIWNWTLIFCTNLWLYYNWSVVIVWCPVLFQMTDVYTECMYSDSYIFVFLRWRFTPDCVVKLNCVFHACCDFDFGCERPCGVSGFHRTGSLVIARFCPSVVPLWMYRKLLVIFCMRLGLYMRQKWLVAKKMSVFSVDVGVQIIKFKYFSRAS